MGQLLRTKRHTATGKQSQALVAAVKRHMPATLANQLRIKDAYFATVSISASQSTLATFLISRSERRLVQLLDAIISQVDA